jgi:hypothetical protein
MFRREFGICVFDGLQLQIISEMLGKKDSNSRNSYRLSRQPRRTNSGVCRDSWNWTTSSIEVTENSGNICTHKLDNLRHIDENKGKQRTRNRTLGDSTVWKRAFKKCALKHKKFLK